ncbi:hypothetical protein J5N97_027846 [Dioscorea zingiberensis]|uniref:Uncharacterized protein n=1 Tax=Dioscorea zingiberensis TaxID=325984 RepID=A0A9D5BY10_9LILI|nr:hypothetical protein J5N97_027846 [Dioscorea zingiberensis]
MFLLLLFLFQISSFLLCKLFNSLHSKRAALLISQEDLQVQNGYISCNSVADEVIGGDEKSLVFLYAQTTLEVDDDDTFVSESAYASPLDDDDLEHSDVLSIHASTPSACPSPIFSSSQASNGEDQGSDEKKFIIIQAHEGKQQQNYGESLNGDYSTSKSSIEWRNSNLLRDSETDYPFSSSSRRSSSRWESYTMFRRYDEEMLFFDRISAQKLNETEYLRSFKIKRSISQRIVHTLTPKRKQSSEGRSIRDPYEELESAYVAQICLTWEALNWNYSNFQRAKTDHECMNISACPARVAQKFQQFQVLLHRFIENEPYEHGRRPEVYARMRICSPKLLQVPEFKDLEGDDEMKGNGNLRISYAEFIQILEDCIETFMCFLKADKESHCEMFRALIKKKTMAVDQNHLLLMKRTNQKVDPSTASVSGSQRSSDWSWPTP